MKKKWETISEEELFQAGIFRLTKEKCKMPDGRIMPHYFVVHFPDWVHLIPITKEGKVIMVRQYRHAARDWFLEFPGGSMDPKSSETPQEAATRELLEETGYKPGKVQSLGAHYPNPALQNNRVHVFLGQNCVKVGDQSLDPYEDLVVEELTVKELKSQLMSQEGHSLMLSSLVLALSHL